MPRRLVVAPPDLIFLAEYHPQVALAVAKGVPLRPNLRPLAVQLQNSQLGQDVRASFAEVFSQYSIFAGVDVTVDPTNDAPGNPLKYVNDFFQSTVTGVTVTLTVKGAGGVDYQPIPEDIPVQSVPDQFAPAIHIWRMVNPENVKARFVLQAVANASPFTIWLNFSFLVLASEGDQYTSYSADQAREELRKTMAWQMALEVGR